MRILTPFFAIAILFVMASPAIAGEPLDFIMNEQAEWSEICAQRELVVVDTHIGVTCNNPRIVTYDLAPGSYYIYASGGMYTRRLNISASGNAGRGFGYDRDDTRYAAIRFVLYEREEVSVSVMPYLEASIFETDYYTLVLAAENGAGIFSSKFEPRPIEPPEPAEGEEAVEVEMDFDPVPPDPDEWATALREIRAEWLQHVIDYQWPLNRHDIFSVTEIPSKLFNYYHDSGYTAVLKVACDNRCQLMELTITHPDGDIIAVETFGPGDEIEIWFSINTRDQYTFDFVPLEFADGFDETYVTYLVATKAKPTEEIFF